jgi:hypothetical protein
MHVKFQGGPLINDHGPQKKKGKKGSEIYNISLISKNLSFFVGFFMKFVVFFKVLK